MADVYHRALSNPATDDTAEFPAPLTRRPFDEIVERPVDQIPWLDAGGTEPSSRSATAIDGNPRL